MTDSQTYIQYFSWIGEKVSWLVGEIIRWLAEQGIKMTPFASKMLTIGIFLAGLYLIFKVIEIANTLVKWLLAGTFILLIVSVMVSFFT